MASPSDPSWRVREHGPLEQLADNLWRVEGALPKMSLRRTMTVVRLPDQRLIIHSAIALEPSTQAALEALGTPSVLLVPNLAHRLDAPAYKARYPGLRVYCPPASRAKVVEAVPVDGTYRDYPGDEVARLQLLRGVRDGEGALIVRSSDGVTVVLNDVVMNMDRKRDVLGFLFTTVLGSAPGPRVSRLSKLVFVDDRKALRDDLEALAALPELTRLVVSHEKVEHGRNAAAALRKAATYL
ncbi:MAG: hypothetical protein ABW252_08205 [Polyangiales bacterium]